jgi:hypothetical protein
MTWTLAQAILVGVTWTVALLIVDGIYFDAKLEGETIGLVGFVEPMGKDTEVPRCDHC